MNKFQLAGAVLVLLLASALEAPLEESESTKLLASDGQADDQFGYALSTDGDTAVVGAIGTDGHTGSSGASYLFRPHRRPRCLQRSGLRV